MERLKTLVLFGLVLFFVGCPGYESKSDKLNKAIRDFHTLLKFQEYLRASDFVVPFYRKDFMDRFASSNVRVEDYEIRGLHTDPKNKSRMEVTIRLLVRPSNSMIIKYTTVVERWVYIRMAWQLVNIKTISKPKHRPGGL